MSGKLKKRKAEKPAAEKREQPNPTQDNAPTTAPLASPSSSKYRSPMQTAAFRIIMIIIITILTRYFQSDMKSVHDDIIPFQVVDIPGKGKGVVASRHIEQGERIITEKPLFIIPQKLDQDPIGYVDGVLSALSIDQRYEFFNLSHGDPNVSQDLLPISIIQTNGIAAGPNRVGLFPRTARLNHGCSSAFNAVYSYRQGENILVVHALRNISKEEEILTAYFDTKKPRDQRREHLLDHYKFHCTCQVCSLPKAKSLASDNRLQEITRLRQVLSSWGSNAISGREAVDVVRSIWKIGEEEGYRSERGQWASDAALIAMAHSDENAAKQWALLAEEWFGYELGQDSIEAANMRTVVENPRRNPNWGTRSDRMNVGSLES